MVWGGKGETNVNFTKLLRLLLAFGLNREGECWKKVVREGARRHTTGEREIDK